jgi:hypothetical protein
VTTEGGVTASMPVDARARSVAGVLEALRKLILTRQLHPGFSRLSPLEIYLAEAVLATQDRALSLRILRQYRRRTQAGVLGVLSPARTSVRHPAAG